MGQPPQDRPPPPRLGGNGPLPAQDDPRPGEDGPLPGLSRAGPPGAGPGPGRPAAGPPLVKLDGGRATWAMPGKGRIPDARPGPPRRGAHPACGQPRAGPDIRQGCPADWIGAHVGAAAAAAERDALGTSVRVAAWPPDGLIAALPPSMPSWTGPTGRRAGSALVRGTVPDPPRPASFISSATVWPRRSASRSPPRDGLVA